MKKYKFTVFDTTFDPKQAVKGRVVEVDSIQEMYSRICKSAWSPILFKDNVRKSENFISSDFLVLDIDGGFSYDDALIYFSTHDHIIEVTKNHEKVKNGISADRFRIVLPLDKPVFDPATYREMFNKAKTVWPFIDDACKDLARFFYPCIGGTDGID